MYLSNYKIPVKGKGEIELPTEILYKKGDKVLRYAQVIVTQ